METFDEFNTRFNFTDDFYACVKQDGHWFDSSESFATAVHWCAMAGGEFHLNSLEEIIWMNDQTDFSIIHSSMLEKMYYAGLIT